MSHPLETPVAFFIFNRPDTTEQVFSRIAQARPKQLMVVADGPRPDRPGEAGRCARAREIAQRVDWPCEVTLEFAPVNLGCRKRVSSGLDSVFRAFPSAIILEDDVLPAPELFGFLQTMLRRYERDERVMMVTGYNPLGQWKFPEQAYHFSFCGSIWGWASWRRAWAHYDVEMKLWDDPAVRQVVADVFADPEVAAPRLASYAKTHAGQIDTWDFQWSFARLIRSGLSIVPAVNIVRNLGFREDATHTRRPADHITDVPVGVLPPVERFHEWVAPDRAYDLAFTRALSGPPGPLRPGATRA